MGQVAFDTLQASEELETAGISREQARAISLVVRKSHEVADVATKRDLEDVRKEIDARFDKTDAQIADVRKDLSAEIADVRKDMEARFEKTEAQMQARFEKTDAQIALLRKDVEHTANGLLIKLSAVMLAIAGLTSTIVTVVIKLL
ncbi:hypothetical protein [Candidatus Sodalis sp. SoCistrobi]|uniref:hypothetical protein n=1 Tax=Candidatus Sodalis sp. SoCistrobi TaxID=1922216 RepID=UPI0009391C2E|nr:hypothetical protein [Candidatus Sodalis sp. SoCistrobi]